MTTHYEITGRLRATSADGIDAARDGLRALTAGALAEPGCLAFSAHQDASAPGDFLTWEVFADEEAFRQHVDYPHTKEFFGAGLVDIVESWVSTPL